jgi:hypothetical protein
MEALERQEVAWARPRGRSAFDRRPCGPDRGLACMTGGLACMTGGLAGLFGASWASVVCSRAAYGVRVPWFDHARRHPGAVWPTSGPIWRRDGVRWRQRDPPDGERGFRGGKRRLRIGARSFVAAREAWGGVTMVPVAPDHGHGRRQSRHSGRQSRQTRQTRPGDLHASPRGGGASVRLPQTTPWERTPAPNSVGEVLAQTPAWPWLNESICAA